MAPTARARQRRVEHRRGDRTGRLTAPVRFLRGVVAENVAVFHHEPNLLGRGDVRAGIARDADHVGEQTGREAATVIDADELGGHDGRGADRLQRGHAASTMSAISSLALPAVRDRGGVGAARDAHAARDRLADRRRAAGTPRPPWPGARGRRGTRPCRRRGRSSRRGRCPLDHEIERLVAGERAVLDAVEARLDHRADAVVAVCVRGDLEPGAVGFVGDRAGAPRRSTAAHRRVRCAT